MVYNFQQGMMAGAASAGGGYTIDQSIRFNDDDSSHLYRDQSAGDKRKATFSCWMKLGVVSSFESIWTVRDNATNPGDAFKLYLQSDTLIVQNMSGAANDWQVVTSQLFRDPSAWYHVVLSVDTDQATDTNRVKVYVNGTQASFSSASYPALNADQDFGSAFRQWVGVNRTDAGGLNGYFDGYLAEINFIDGTALDPTSFGETNADGVWIPKAYTGSYGTNGFYITGEDSTFLGQDVRTSGDQVNSFQAAQYTGATSDYTFSDGRVEANVSDRAIRTVDTFTGDFEFTWSYVNMANFGFGLYEIDEDATFSSTSSAGNMQSMTDSWYIKTSSVASNRDIYYGGTVVVESTTIANGDVWKMTRESGTIKVYRNGSLIHTYAQTSTNEVRLVIAQGDAAADANQIAWVDNSTLGNNFFSSGLTAADQMLDTPTDNFCTLNPLYKDSAVVLSDGNLTATSASSNRVSMSTFAVNSGKWYWEMTFTGTIAGAVYGIGKHPVTLNNYLGIDQYGWSVLGGYSGAKLTNNSGGGFGETYKGSNVLSGETVACALDMDTGKVYWGSDGTTDGTGTFAWYASGDPVAGTNFAFSDLTGDIYPACDADSRGTMVVNFGQSPFRYSADIPTNFNALSTANLPSPSITDGSAHFQPTLYTGTGSSLAVTQAGNSTFQPDWVWIKGRSGATEHVHTDTVRGVTKELSSNDAGAEETVAQGLTAFDSAGFTVGTDGSYNTSSATYVGWQWKANGAGSSNEDGSITSTVSADTTSGFSIIRWSGTGANGTIGHGLGIQPSLYIVKNTATTNSWMVGSTLYDNTKFLILNATDALDTAAAVWNSAYPTSSVVNLGSNVASNGSGTNNMICYAFAEIPGYSSIGSYTGNGSTDGPFVYTDFKPAFVMTKRTNAAGDWKMWDNQRGPYNVNGLTLAANSSGSESSGVAQHSDFLSNGFKIRGNDTETNGSGSTYIYMAFAENPFGGDGVAPATAR